MENKEKKLYLNQWNFNCYLIINELKKEVLKNGGFIVSSWQKEKETTTIFNRTISEYKIKIEEFKKVKQKYNKKELEELAKSNGYIKNMIELEKDFTNYDYKENKGEKLTTTSYLHFVLNNKLYYLQFDENPFFEWYFSKNEISNDLKCSKNYYLQKLNKNIYDLDSYYSMANKKDVERIAKNYFDYLVNSKDSQHYNNKTRKESYFIIED